MVNEPLNNRLSPAALYEQLAEECAELGKAAQKKARILRGENPTPVTNEEADANLIEEFTDVIQCANVLGLEVNPKQMDEKNKRWHERLDKRDLEAGFTNLKFHSYQEYPSHSNCKYISLRFVSNDANDKSKYILSLSPIPSSSFIIDCIGSFSRDDERVRISTNAMNKLLCMIIRNNYNTKIAEVLERCNITSEA